jgi:aminoglycoside phosphotransferase family enzyme/predicted kinase
MSGNDQQAVIDFLGAPASHGGEKVTRVDTHAAVVFLTPGRVLKIKRAVKFPFLDFSTLEKRKTACAAELEVNRPFAPAIYRQVVPITRTSDGRLAIGGDGAPVEWAVEMARFDETQTLDHLAPAGKIDDRLADALGNAVAEAHERVPVVRGFGFADALENIVRQNDAELREAPDLFAADQAAALTERTLAALTRVRSLLTRREQNAFVRRCHGDLHLGNIVLIGGKPTLFDAIEFDERIATGDVLYDLAFLLMDLIERGLSAPATIVFNRYLATARSDDNLDALAALPLFMSVRAAIRAKVTAARRKHATSTEEAARSARDYFALAGRLIEPPPPQLVAVGGLSGTGKSVLARALAAYVPPAPGAFVLRSDMERKRLFNVAETEKLPPAGYTHEVTEKVYATLAAKAARVIAAGHSAVVDAVFARADERHGIAHAAHNVPFRGLFLTADLETRVARVGSRVADASDADAAVARRQEQYRLDDMDWTEVDASGTPHDTCDRARSALKLR